MRKFAFAFWSVVVSILAVCTQPSPARGDQDSCNAARTAAMSALAAQDATGDDLMQTLVDLEVDYMACLSWYSANQSGWSQQKRQQVMAHIQAAEGSLNSGNTSWGSGLSSGGTAEDRMGDGHYFYGQENWSYAEYFYGQSSNYSAAATTHFTAGYDHCTAGWNSIAAAYGVP